MFKPEEAGVVRVGLEAMLDVTHAWQALGDHIVEARSSISKLQTYTAARALARTMRDMSAGAFALIGGLPKDFAGTRADQLHYAWEGPPFGFTRAAKETLPLAWTLLKEIGIFTSALKMLEWLEANRPALLLSDPPPGGEFGGRRTIIGPHGDFYRAQHYGWSTVHYLNDWAEEGFLPVFETAPFRCHVDLADAWRVVAMLIRVHLEAAALNAGVPLHTRWENLPVLQGSRQFSWALAALGLEQRAVEMADGDGAPEFYAALGNAWRRLLPNLTLTAIRGPWARGSDRSDDSWRRANQFAWMANFFPDRRAG